MAATTERTANETLNVGKLLDAGRAALGASPTPYLDAQILLATVLRAPRSRLYSTPEYVPPADVCTRYLALIEQRAAGVPVAYLIGTREFWSLEFEVSRDTLIPRPETELLVDLVLQSVPADRPARIADLGTGSGAIAIALARERPTWRILATDISIPALAIARRNATRLEAGNVEFVCARWHSSLARARFDAIVSNPPYVCAGDARLDDADICHEPRTALDGGRDGLDALRAVVAGAPAHLVPGGVLCVEHGEDQGQAVRELMAAQRFRGIATHRDLAGLERATCGRHCT